MPRHDSATQLLTTTLQEAYTRLGLEGGSVLLAVSGGADSTALLMGTVLVAERLRLRVEVASLDHGLRPEAAEEARQVSVLAAARGLPCHVQALRLHPGVGIEARAREARYAALEALRLERGLDVVATAHTATDQAETLLMRLARGTALRGAVGIHEARPGLVRPLLSCTREEVVAFLAEQGVAYVTDPMNTDPVHFRTRVRLGVLPALSRAAGFAVEGHLAAFARVVAEDESLLASMADAAFDRLRLEDGALDAVGVRALEPALRRRVLARLVAGTEAAVDEATLARVQRAVAQGGTATLGRGYVLRATSGRVRCVRQVPSTPPAELRLEHAGSRGALAGTGWNFSVEFAPPPAGVLGLALGDGTRWPLTVRTRRPGDRVCTAGGQRKLQDVLVDLRVPAEARATRPVVADAEGQVLWLPGLWSPVAPRAAAREYLWAVPPGSSIQRTAAL
ncbi:tRNA(Ile)-lysidine synthetase [Myxococcus xanthus DK 1622]|uniref:tRNA(Ile)-lysidine synthase n=1 Tax=Myxococcus xanthus (strain DK1622) TaxID=246197 RepID=Q1D490_MYXXD|nr:MULTISPECIES: tRNA lysidine(34) synthetase TilS [Myxococcus]ABF87925.1 tRNA(Ile)-lysidine synthetase [Myxococcus xanthus DK 1622]NOJ51088.1 tRNA lysidine(34) synthetase TilS [Myxococcus xanthus]QPM76949.1 tRNA lysidine(34) synthetase TilS [Myxococcus xanthus]QVW66016.1 tRNA lysidine(34) synthetase TilS [Myxococcus xanthus DZ2]QZZ52043.1 tRNA(Ile)-lysidine synthase [Myxococcus xanthus]